MREITENGTEQFGRFYSVYRAYAFDNNDPLSMGRLKVVCPCVWGEQVFDSWVRPFGMVAGKNYGFVQLPEKAEGINLMFENGDPNFPVWTYGWFAESELPTEVQGRGDNVAIWKTKGGQSIFIDDEESSVKITTEKGANILIKGNEISVSGDSITLLNGGQKAVLGGRLESLLTKLIDTLITTTAAGSPLSSVAQLTAMKAEIKTILSQKITLE